MTDRWGEVAGQYLTSQWHANDEALQKLIAMVKPNGGLVLDVGTGAGHTAFAFAPFVDAVIAFDSSQGMLDVAAAEANRRGLANFETKLGDAHDLPYADAMLDGVVVRCATHHFKDPRKFLGEAARVLKSSGWFLLVDTIGIQDAAADEQLDQIERWRDPTHIRNLTVQTWTEIAAATGLSQMQHETHAKRLNANDWLNRQRTPEPQHSQTLQAIQNSSGTLKEYLNWFGSDDELVFHLQEAAILFRKP